VRLPPEITRGTPVRDGDEVFIDRHGKLVRVRLKPKKENISTEAEKLVEMMDAHSLGNYKFKREDAYE